MCSQSLPTRIFLANPTANKINGTDTSSLVTASRPNGLIRVMGIDPGSVITGYGIIESDGARSFHLTHGHIRVKGDSFPERLGHIHAALGDIINEWQPQEVAIEQVFLSNNPMSALKLGQARGAAITAAISRQLTVAEYAPRLVKKVVTGSGAADKKQVQIMVRALLQIIPEVQVDAADGLAIAICHAHSRKAPGGTVLPQRKRTRGRGLRL
ncbi:Crossover junction endodeoxyribonuclease RuvC [Granulosicoccus antarcticus IMCC3135]|uniref:Crossover junction endodeoxyribonuclease RuvC n=2 Tax=Granulosicoccus TaxID=437504 RepID=A0A2Z2NWF6_9GAMM|nr:Crossover junction endodeoxyribonuclease RuvC [Granulosicoccus antarcticus IMCC3135]